MRNSIKEKLRRFVECCVYAGISHYISETKSGDEMRLAIHLGIDEYIEESGLLRLLDSCKTLKMN